MDVVVGIVAQRANERAQRLAGTLLDELAGHSVDTVIDEETADAIGVDPTPVGAMADADLVVSIGGDGTLLFVARAVGDVPILGVNLGEVGFLNAVQPEDALAVVSQLVDALAAGESLESRELIRLTATDPAGRWTLEPAMNEVVVHGPRRGPGSGGTIEVFVDGDQYIKSHADGVLVATPTGSTAYNLSERGPLVYPTTRAIVITAMAASEPTAPLVVDPTVEVTLEISDAETAYAISDGRNRRSLEPPATVSIEPGEKPVRLVGPPVNFVDALTRLE